MRLYKVARSQTCLMLLELVDSGPHMCRKNVVKTYARIHLTYPAGSEKYAAAIEPY